MNRIIPISSILLIPLVTLAMSPEKVIKMTEEYCYEFPQEKAYVMTDKANYIGGDTIWFRGFVVDAASHQPVKVSRYLYVELSDPFGDVVQRVKIRENDGIYSGYLSLDLDMADGEYQLTAYTNFMQNQSIDFFPEKKLIINNPFAIKKRILHEWNPSTRKLKIMPVDSDNNPLQYESLYLTTADGKRYRQSHEKNIFKLSEKEAGNGLVKITCDNHSAFITLSTAESNNYDVTFHPEGGYLIPGKECTVAFKAIGKDGKGIDLSGTIIDSNGKEITKFKTLHAGMGKTAFTPDNGEKYEAIISDGKRFELPSPHNDATVVQVHHTTPDSITISIAGNQLAKGTIILQQRGIVLWASEVDSNSSIKFDSRDALSGVMQVLLLDSNNNLLSERLIFCDNDNNTYVSINTESKTYGNRQLVGTDINISNPVGGNFAVSVIDNHMSAIDSISPIKAQLLLSSDLNGYIENPGYYFSSKSPAIAEALDNLMLTQGWRRYDIPALLNGNITEPVQPIEKSMSLTGTVNSKWRGKQLKDISVALMSPATGYGNITTTDENGIFRFDGFEYPDGTTYFIQAVNHNGGFEDNIKIDSLVLPNIKVSPFSYKNDNFKTSLPALRRRVETNPELNSILLSEVIVSELMMKSENRWLTGVASSQISAYDLKLNNINSIEDAIGRLNGVSVGGSGNITFRGKPIGVFIDNVPLDATVCLGMGSPEPIDAGLKAIRNRTKMFRQSSLRDPKGYISTPAQTNLPEINIIREIENVCSFDNIASISFVRGGASAIIGNRAPGGTIVITTKDGNAFAKIREHNPHIAIAKPLGYQRPAEFYSPKYEPTERPDGTDLRSTVYWNPCVRIGDDGKADFEFFTSDNPSTSYTMLIEGISDDGRIITGTASIKIE